MTRLYEPGGDLARPCPRCGRLDARWDRLNVPALTYRHPCGEWASSLQAVATYRIAEERAWPAMRDTETWPATEPA